MFLLNHGAVILGTSQIEILYVWREARPEGKAIIFILVLFSIFAWSIMAAKTTQMRRARRLNQLFDQEFKAQKELFEVFDRQIAVEGCPLFTIYRIGCEELSVYLRKGGRGDSEQATNLSVKCMGHIKRVLERVVAEESLKLESGLIVLAITVSGAPFLGLLGTVWGVMSTFAQVAQAGNTQLTTMAPGVAAALATTVAGLLVAIPSMFGYNWLLHNLRVLTVEMDNYAQELASQIESEYMIEEE